MAKKKRKSTRKRKPTKIEHDVLKKGIGQLDRRGLKRLIKHIDDKKPLRLDGGIWDEKTKVG